MNTQTLGVGLAALIIGILIGYSIAPENDSFIGYRTMGPLSIDQHFIEQMIPHHQGAIAMAEIVLHRSTRPEVLSLANDIIEAQTNEIEDMRSWYEAWFGAQVPITSQTTMGGHSMVHMNSMSGDIDELETATNVDQEFLEQMIPHHEMAVMMASMLLATTERDEMKTLADQIITSQNREIETMRNWLIAW